MALLLVPWLLWSGGRAEAAPAPDNHTVLILGSTVTGGLASNEATKAATLGFTVEIADAADWTAKTTADFATYRAIILGDPSCVTSALPVDTAVATKAVWGPAITGNVVVLGTDPTVHRFRGGDAVTRDGIAFATGQPGKTGAYITLSCYYCSASPGTPVPLLDAFAPGAFTVDGEPCTLCFNDAHIVATSPALAGLSDANVSNWSCSVHEAFDTWPADFQVLAIARNLGSVFTASDGTVGTPYILARGVRPIGFSLSPVAGVNLVGTTHTVTATLSGSAGGAFVSGALIGFQITAGPNAGAAATCSPSDCRTDVKGQVSFTYSDAGGAGIDSILAWDDMNENGTPDVGEPRATARETWLSSIPPVRNPLNPGIHLQADGFFCADTSVPCATPFPSPGNFLGLPLPAAFEWQGTSPQAFVPGPTGATPTFLDDHSARAFVYASVDTEPGGTGEVNFYLNYDILEPSLLPYPPGEIFTVQFDVAAGRFAGRMVVDLHCADRVVMVSGFDNGVPFASRPADQLGIEGACGAGISPNPTGDPFFDVFTDVDGVANGFNNPHPIIELEIPLTQNLGGNPRPGGGVYDPSPAFWSASDPPAGPFVFSQNMIALNISDGSTTLTPLPPTTATTTTTSSTSTTSTTTTSVTSTTINAAPDCRGAVADPAVLWPPNHRFVDVSVVGVTDPDADPVTVTITGITQDEPPGTTCSHGTGVGTASASLRAERLGSGDGRVYHVSFTADDGRGGRCSGTVTVCVPHDQRAGHVCGDQGPLFDSSACP